MHAVTERQQKNNEQRSHDEAQGIVHRAGGTFEDAVEGADGAHVQEGGKRREDCVAERAPDEDIDLEEEDIEDDPGAEKL